MADFDLKKFDLEHWWKMIAAAGALIIIASIAVKFVPTIFIGLGLLSIGVGEWWMHPTFTVPVQEGFQQWLVTTQERRPFPAGMILDGIGALLCIVGLVKLALA